MKTIFLNGNSLTIPAIEMLCACQGLDFTSEVETGRAMKAGRGGDAAYRFVRNLTDHEERDRILYNDIQTALELVRNNAVLHRVERTFGSLDS